MKIKPTLTAVLIGLALASATGGEVLELEKIKVLPCGVKNAKGIVCSGRIGFCAFATYPPEYTWQCNMCGRVTWSKRDNGPEVVLDGEWYRKAHGSEVPDWPTPKAWITGWSNSSGNHQTNSPVFTNLWTCVGSRMFFGYVEDFRSNDVTAIIGRREVLGRFWTEWERKDGCAERTREVLGAPTQMGVATNYTLFADALFADTYNITNSYWPLREAPCTKEHWDSSEHVDTTYSQSNLWARLVWRGVTNEWCLESVCCDTNTRKWRWEKVRKYEP